MADGSHFLPFDRELVVDGFAGHGGASHGIGEAYQDPDIAMNHNEIAMAVHRLNHPRTRHYECDIFEVDPAVATGGRPVAAAWFSPDCRHHSRAAGGKPRSKRVRGLAWVVIRWAAVARPRVILLENVPEFAEWGPLLPNGQPDPAKKGKTFRHWAARLRNLGYEVEWRELVAADYGAPTIRKRLYVIARCDGRPIVWPEPTHAENGAGGLKPWRTAAECVDWSIPGRTVFREKPLAANTERRIAKGLWKHVLNTDKPFLAPGCAPFLTEFANASNQRTFAADEPLRTQVAQVKGGHFALVGATLVQTGYGEREGQAPRCLDPNKPLGTVVAGGGKHAIACAHFEQANGGWYDGDGRAATDPLSTITTSGANQRLVSAYFVKYYGNERDGVSLRAPMHTVTTKDRLGLVQTVQVPRSILTEEQWAGAKRCADFLHKYLPEHFPEPADAVLWGDYVLVDITLRMLVPRELARAQGFSDDYDIEHGLFETFRGSGVFVRKPISKTEQVRGIGNSVCPPVAKALAAANLADLIQFYAEAA